MAAQQSSGTIPGWIVRSDDGGISFRQLIKDPKGWSSVSVSSDGTQIVATGPISRAGFLMISRDGGTNFAPQTEAGSAYWPSVVISQEGDKLFACQFTQADKSPGWFYTSDNWLD